MNKTNKIFVESEWHLISIKNVNIFIEINPAQNLLHSYWSLHLTLSHPQQHPSEVILVRLVHCVIRQQGNPRAMDNPKKLVESCWCLLESGLAVGDTSWEVSWIFVGKHFQVVEFESNRPKQLTYLIHGKQTSSSKRSNWRGELLVRKKVQKKTLLRARTCKRGLLGLLTLVF